ncbi:amidohydrolase family protein [Methylobacterium nonmethylotrophicum]|uniref:Amidohydrolase n=1 Tax=Methylobacterium nonmethylotrophicum TaxID=1141884 RepID=A0A4Z0NDK4_9HYPH|nr:amidohydrolase family protein [Methylobacterium nonmethylotrophicum]TGD93295.1 amidohydrolase [Methylobacterium nonmethylotrophicum]
MRIDAHHHLWRLADRPGAWPPPNLAAIHRDFTPDDLAPLLAAAGIDGTVLVQTLEDEAETDAMLALAGRHGAIRGVVGWTDLKAADAPAAIARLAGDPRLKGLRPMLQDHPDDAWIADPALAPAIDAMVAHDLAFDALVRPRQLASLLTFATRHPHLRIVIDHGAKPAIGRGGSPGWGQALAALAARPNVACKLSGLLTEAEGGGPEAVRPYAETILDLFGPGRVMWGSDWPVLNLAGDYGAWFAQCRDWVPPAHHDAVFGANAVAFYRLDPA